MSVWPMFDRDCPALITPEGELVSVQIAVDPWLLEDLLEALARLPFPVNPEIYHSTPIRVEFPAYGSRLEEVRDALRRQGFDPSSMSARDMLAEITDRAE